MDRERQRRVNSSNKKRYIILFLFTLILTLFFFRHSFLEIGVKYALGKISPNENVLSYEKIRWHKGKLILEGLHLQHPSAELSTNQVEIDFKLDFFSPYCQVNLQLIDPEIHIRKREIPSFLLVLGMPSSRFYGIKFDLSKGVVVLDTFPTKSFSFDFISGSSKDEIGVLSLEFPNEAHAEITLKKEQGDLKAHLDFSSTYKEMLFSFFSLENVASYAEDRNVKAEISFKGNKLKKSFIEGKIELEGDISEILEFGCEIEPICFSRLDDIKIDGWILSECLSPKVYEPFFKAINKDIDIKGDWEVVGKFDREKVMLSLQANDVAFTHPLFDVIIDKMGEEKRLELFFDLKNSSCFGEIPLRNAQIYDKKRDYVFNGLEGTLHFDNTSQISLKDFSFSLNEHIALSEVGFGIKIPDDGESVSLECVEGNLWIKDDVFALEGKEISIGKTNSHLNLALFDSEKEIIHCIADLQVDENLNLSVALDNEHTHFFGSRLNLSPFLIKEHKCVSLKGKPHILASQIAPGIGFLKNCNFLNINEKYLESLLNLHLEGEIIGNFSYTLEKDFLFEANSKNLKLNDKMLATSHLKGKKSGAEILIEELKIGDLNFKAALVQEKQNIALPQFEVEMKGVYAQGDALCNFEDKKLTGNIQTFNFDLTHTPRTSKVLKGRGAIKGAFDLSFPGTEVAWVLDSKLLLSFSSSHPLPLNVKSEKSFSLKGTSTKGFFTEDLSLDFMDSKGARKFLLPLKNLTYKNDESSCLLSGKTKINDQTLFGMLQLEFANSTFGMLKIQESPQSEGVKILFNSNASKGFEIKSIEGSLNGSIIKIKKDENIRSSNEQDLRGKIRFDVERFIKFLSKDQLKRLERFKLGNSCTLDGLFTLTNRMFDPFHFTGTFKAKDFFLLGFQFQAMEAEIEASAKQIFGRNFHITDKAGVIEIKEVKMIKEDETWEIKIPLFQMRDFTPSLLVDAKSKASHAKTPFVIKNLSLFNITGNVGDISTFKGGGSFVFTNKDKKEPNFLDIPLEKIKSFGLDPGLLTPIQGEIDFQLIGDKLIFSEIKNMFSEGKRSDFYLTNAIQDSYVDLSGNLHINLKMHQDVTLKLLEPFVLKVRGTLTKPRYGFGT